MPPIQTKSIRRSPLRLPTKRELDDTESDMIWNEYGNRFSEKDPVFLSSEEVDAMLRKKLKQSLS